VPAAEASTAIQGQLGHTGPDSGTHTSKCPILSSQSSCSTNPTGQVCLPETCDVQNRIGSSGPVVVQCCSRNFAVGLA
jgi:hypothetical protein